MADYGFAQSEIGWGTGYNTEQVIRRTCQEIKAMGGTRLRFTDQVGQTLDQPTPWTELDLAMNIITECGLKPLWVMMRRGDGSAPTFNAWAKAVTARYGASGTGQLDTIEVGNEVNWSAFLDPPSASFYLERMLKPAYEGIKSVQPSMTVITAGTIPAPTGSGFVALPIPPFFFFPSANSPPDWLTSLYSLGGQQYMDGVGYHWYSDALPTLEHFAWKWLLDVRAIMVANGDASKKVLVTEMGYSQPNLDVAALTVWRDHLKIQVDALLSYDWAGPFCIYSYRDAIKGAADNSFGVVDFDFTLKEPYRGYVATIGNIPTDPSDPGDTTPPDAPTGVGYGDVTSSSVRITWAPNDPADGVTNYRVYNDAGVKLADTPATSTDAVISGLPSGVEDGFYVVAVDQAGNPSDPSDTVLVTTDAPTGTESAQRYVFVGSTVPTVIGHLGVGYSVSGGVALHNLPTTDGLYQTLAPYWLELQSPNHRVRITLAGPAAQADRSALAVGRLSADGTQWVAAFSGGGGNADSLQVLSCIGGVVTTRAAFSATPGTAGQVLEIEPADNVYTARLRSGVDSSQILAEVAWTDLNGVFPGVTNRGTAIGWQHKRVGGVNYNANGVTAFEAKELVPVAPVGSANDVWMFAAVDEDDVGLVMATGLWEPSLT